jgi:hypothetical protein
MYGGPQESFVWEFVLFLSDQRKLHTAVYALPYVYLSMLFLKVYWYLENEGGRWAPGVVTDGIKDDGRYADLTVISGKSGEKRVVVTLNGKVRFSLSTPLPPGKDSSSSALKVNKCLLYWVKWQTRKKYFF